MTYKHRYGHCSVCGRRCELYQSGNIHRHWKPVELRKVSGDRYCNGSNQPASGANEDLVAELRTPGPTVTVDVLDDVPPLVNYDLVHRCGAEVPADQNRCPGCGQPVMRLPRDVIEIARWFEGISGLDKARTSILGVATQIYMAGWNDAMEQVADAQNDAWNILQKAAQVKLTTQEWGYQVQRRASGEWSRTYPCRDRAEAVQGGNIVSLLLANIGWRLVYRDVQQGEWKLEEASDV